MASYITDITLVSNGSSFTNSSGAVHALDKTILDFHTNYTSWKSSFPTVDFALYCYQSVQVRYTHVEVTYELAVSYNRVSK